jgi:molybdopterin/thiamine biosynthesis adenylyltransferase
MLNTDMHGNSRILPLLHAGRGTHRGRKQRLMSSTAVKICKQGNVGAARLLYCWPKKILSLPLNGMVSVAFENLQTDQ